MIPMGRKREYTEYKLDEEMRDLTNNDNINNYNVEIMKIAVGKLM